MKKVALTLSAIAIFATVTVVSLAGVSAGDKGKNNIPQIVKDNKETVKTYEDTRKNDNGKIIKVEGKVFKKADGSYGYKEKKIGQVKDQDNTPLETKITKTSPKCSLNTTRNDRGGNSYTLKGCEAVQTQPTRSRSVSI